MSKSRKNQEKRFSCLNCGEPFTVYPPDDYHPFASLSREGTREPIEMNFVCKNKECAKTTKIYWSKPPKPIIVTG